MTSAWRLITSFDGPFSHTPQALRGSLNMAIDQALLESVQAGGRPVLRFYRWTPACLSLGRNQPARVQRVLLGQQGIDLVRRPTGGLAVLHDQELTYAVAVRAAEIGSPRSTYQSINRGLRRGLAALGTAAVPTAEDSSARAFAASGSCFAAAAPGELVAQGGKLIGSAQRYEARSILQHGSILLAGDQSLAMRAFTEERRPRSVTLRELLGHVPDWPHLTEAFATGVAQELGILLAPGSLTESERVRALQLVEHYNSDGWTLRV